MFLGKNKISTSAQSSLGVENGQINSSVNKPPNLINPDEKKRITQQLSDGLLPPPIYGKTLNVPDPNALQVLPIVTSPAPITPPRPAIMTTPKSSMANAKNIAPDIRPTLLVTTANDKLQPQTITVPNGRRLPVNGRLAIIAPTKQRQQPIVPVMTNNNHQMINEITPKKIINHRPRTAVYYSPTRMIIK
jgi:hypothetical protein